MENHRSLREGWFLVIDLLRDRPLWLDGHLRHFNFRPEARDEHRDVLVHDAGRLELCGSNIPLSNYLFSKGFDKKPIEERQLH